MEVRVRTSSHVVLILITSAVVSLATTMIRDELRGRSRDGVIRTSNLELIDTNGRTRIVMRLEEGTPVLRFFDSSGRQTMSLVASNTRATVKLGPSGEQPQLEMVVDREGLLGPALFMASSKGRTNLVLGNAPIWDLPPPPGSEPERWGLVLYEGEPRAPRAGLFAIRQPNTQEYRSILVTQGSMK